MYNNVCPYLKCLHQLNDNGVGVLDDNSDIKDPDIERLDFPLEGCADFLNYRKRKWLLKYHEIEAYGLDYGLWVCSAFFPILCTAIMAILLLFPGGLIM